ncbi:MAG TPA: RagB/SusD family nutrient uptake outer membrane protein [Prolixibacteraceae bacterium]|nr:RagB/SusD family nutrient uptake outer membrane protein [Prolixibacteraceae bacterium]
MKINNSVATGLIALALAACTDLSENLYDRVQSADYGKTPAEIETIVGRAYAALRGFNDGVTISYPANEYVLFLKETTSDEACIPTRGTDWYDGGRYQEAQTHTWTPENPMLLSAWRYYYETIGRINAVIYQVDQSELTPDEKDVVNAELRGLRAYLYYELLDMFGNVPIVTSFEELELPTNSTRAQVYEFVETELLEIMDLLPSGILYGRFTQNVANTLLARLYLNSEVYIGEARWQECINACDKVNGYVLENNFFTSFLTDNQVSREIIFAIPYDHTEGTTGNYFASLTFHYNQRNAFSATGNYTDCVNGICCQPGVYGMYEENDIRRNGYLIGDQIDRATGNVIIMPATGNPLTYTDEIADYFHALQNEGVRIKKYEVQEGEVWERDHDFVVMRYSEILLMKAECYIRMGSPALARPLVAQVRERAGVDTPAEVDLEFLDDELLREFAFEGHRRTDNIRMGDFFKPWWNKGATEAFRGIFPIPARALELNSKLAQNPNY